MSAINLFILGFLMEKPINAYELAGFIDEYNLNAMIKISTPAVYKNLKKMHKLGYLESQIVKEGEMPEKAIYSITKKGKSYFLDLMNSISSNDYKIHFDFNSFIVHLDKVKKSDALLMLEKLRNTLYKKKIFYKEGMEKYHFIPLHGRATIKQHYMLNNTLIEWIEDFIQEYTGKE